MVAPLLGPASVEDEGESSEGHSVLVGLSSVLLFVFKGWGWVGLKVLPVALLLTSARVENEDGNLEGRSVPLGLSSVHMCAPWFRA